LQTALRAHPTINLSDACRHGLRLAVARQERVLFDALVRDARLAICKEFGVPPLPSWDQWTVTVTDTWPNDGDPEG
jgi:hypothetical protein